MFQPALAAIGVSLSATGSAVKVKLPMMNQTNGWMSGWMGGGMWIWTVIGVLVVVLLAIVIVKLSKK